MYLSERGGQSSTSIACFSYQEYLEYQRQLALQRMQDQERERQMRFEQQKQMQHMRAMQTYYPQVRFVLDFIDIDHIAF